ncbi:hypothetical protein CISG_05236 [Coccidioides immitis RMSCC 3703]|uniref:Protein kinase domain-containing protein n=2 Tax=Coccidioides immitis TaxID=5501 RepID=A0A0J8QSN9_COCIT|nr:hypothetical protein CIRG_00080 [Coccidioides immitis RMSCC 2394]KMU75839.1 hypothetical protein CISG_05236 [Coccidioides immitis RMSCC 3703]
MAGNNSPDYKALFFREIERTHLTTFDKYLQTCHDSSSRSLRVAQAPRSTKASSTKPTGKLCPTRLRLWTGCPARQQDVYDTVRNYFRASEADAPRIFSPIIGLESYERFGVQDHVHDVIAELCKIPNARSEFSLGDGIQFENHANTLDKLDSDISGEFKPPHKLPVEYIRVGLRPMEFWEEVVQREAVPTDPAEKLKYNAEQLTGAVLAQEYHVMIHEGLDYSYIINGFALILLHAGCAPEATAYDSEPTDSSDTDLNQAPPRRKRNLSQITLIPSHSATATVKTHPPRMLDGQCPNVELHRRGREGKHHLITADCLVQLLKEQLDENLDHKCTSFGDCGAFGAPFKITCATYGYTVVGRGTTCLRWNEVSREADVYRILKKGSGIRHMLLMAWGGKDTTKLEHSEALTREIRRSNREIRALGVIHKDFRHGNVLWNDELQRALIIDFHRSELERRPIEKRVKLRKRSPYKVDLLALWIEEVSNF